MKAKSDYKYKIIQDHIFIIDLNIGGMSVTNDIENVIDDICEKELLIPNTIVTYRDSEGEWDRYDYYNNKFITGSDIVIKMSYEQGWKDKVTY
jgi:hypothetical protein